MEDVHFKVRVAVAVLLRDVLPSHVEKFLEAFPSKNEFMLIFSFILDFEHGITSSHVLHQNGTRSVETVLFEARHSQL